MNQTALLVIGVQREYFPGGRLPLAEPERALARIQQLLGWARRQGHLVIHLLQSARRAGAPYFAPGSPGVQPHPELVLLAGEQLVEIHWPGAFTGTGLADMLRERQVGRVVICGFPTHLSVDTTAREAFHLGFQVVVAGDACTTRDLRLPGGGEVIAPLVQAAALAALADGMARILSTDQLLEARE